MYMYTYFNRKGSSFNREIEKMNNRTPYLSVILLLSKTGQTPYIGPLVYPSTFPVHF